MSSKSSVSSTASWSQGRNGWSLFPPALNIAGKMKPHNSNRLSPIPHSDDQEPEYAGAEVRDIPLYRPSTSSGRKENIAILSIDTPRPAPHTHDLVAQVSEPSLHRKVAREALSGASFEDRGTVLLAPLTPSELLAHFDEPDSLSIPIRTSNSRSRSPPRIEQVADLEPIEFQQTIEHEEEMEYQDRAGSSRSHQRNITPALQSPSTIHSRSRSNSERDSYQTNATSLPALQQRGLDENDQLDPLNAEDLDPGCFDLVAPGGALNKQYSLETRSELLFSTEHLKKIFADPSLLLRFTAFLSTNRPASIPILIYYLDAIKALKAISYANAIAEALDPISGFDFTATTAKLTVNEDLQEKAKLSFEVMVREDLPAYITHIYIQTVSLSIQRRVTGTLPSHLREASEGLAEVFCLTDPSRPDNPIVFASAEFHRTTQYGMSYVIGRNCRFLQGPKTNPFSVRRIREKLEAGVEHCEVFLNYRRDGSPFMNLLMCAPLCDSRGVIRYFIGAQVDVSGLVKECSDLESLKRIVIKSDDSNEQVGIENEIPPKDEFQELSEMMNLQELDIVRRWGGRMHKQSQEDNTDTNYNTGNWNKPRLLISSESPDGSMAKNFNPLNGVSGRLSGIYENYLLVRPYPSLRILFASPSLRVPGILQSPFMAKIGGSNRLREDLTRALANGQGVTAKVKWVSKNDLEGRSRWVHCTPMQGTNGTVGVWMIVIVDDEESQPNGKRFKMAPPVDPKFGRSIPLHNRDDASLRDFAIMNGGRDRDDFSLRGGTQGSIRSHTGQSERSASPYSLRIT